MTVVIRPMKVDDAAALASAFQSAGWRDKTEARFGRYLDQMSKGAREVLVADVDGAAGYVTILWSASHSPFLARSIPEIADLNVIPPLQRRGIGRALVLAAEARIAANHRIAGIGVGLTAAYGAAQRLYVKLGYVPDGSGISINGVPVAEGEQVTTGHGLTLHLIKVLA